VNEDCLKLTSYFGERQRTENAFLADALLDLYGDREIATSILLRGVGGFGLRHHLRTDQSLSLSEDPPVMAVAVDTREKIAGLLDDVLKIKRRGLLTLERARMLREEIGPVTLPEDLHEATRLTIYVGRQERVFRVPAYIAVCDLLHRRGIAGASVLLGVDGTAHGERERARFFDRNTDVPVMIIAVGSGERIAKVLPELGGLLQRPLITLERVRVCKRDGELFERPHALPGVDEHGLGMWQKITMFSSESAQYDRQPVHRALIRRLRESNVARGATALRGIWGFHGDHEPHGDKLFQLARHVPVTTIIIDTPAHIAQSFDIIDEVTQEHGLVISEMVPALLSLHDDTHRGGLRLARHDF
jgi:PII-like signaling protein